EEADTTYGKLGVKVWLYKGEMLPGMTEEDLPVYKNKKNDKNRKRRNNNRKGKSQAAKN
ncbi:MAG: 30S ribosomal protein S3, partial [Staphylococcus hominis]